MAQGLCFFQNYPAWHVHNCRPVASSCAPNSVQKHLRREQLNTLSNIYVRNICFSCSASLRLGHGGEGIQIAPQLPLMRTEVVIFLVIGVADNGCRSILQPAVQCIYALLGDRKRANAFFGSEACCAYLCLHWWPAVRAPRQIITCTKIK